MKKLVLIIVVTLFSASSYGQGFIGGLNVGIPVGDAEEGYSFAIGLDLNFLWEVSDTFDAGIATGYSHFIGKEIDLGSFGTIDAEDAGFIPLAAAGRLALSETFMLGADLGYAIGVSPDENDGGFYYRPMIGYNLSEGTQLTLSYSGVSVDGGTFSGIHLGVNFQL